MLANEHIKVASVDDDPFELEAVRDALRAEPGFVTEDFVSPQQFVDQVLAGKAFDAVVLDYSFGPLSPWNGRKIVERMSDLTRRPVIIVRTGQIDFLEDGFSFADDFVHKSESGPELATRLARALALRPRSSPAAQDHDAATTAPVGATMRWIERRAFDIVSSGIRSVHVSGETGTGKEVVADLFEKNLGAGLPFVRVNCAALAPEILEAELFGYVKGAFTGATTDKKGLLDRANGGWIFFDEVAELSTKAQAALLRVFETGQFSRVGDLGRATTVACRFLTATNACLATRVSEGTFRQDLWQRMCEGEISLPPLRERPDEIRPLANFFANTAAGGPYTITEPAIRLLCQHSWSQGNVRELRNCVRAMTERKIGQFLTPMSLPDRFRQVWAATRRQAAETSSPERTTMMNHSDLANPFLRCGGERTT